MLLQLKKELVSEFLQLIGASQLTFELKRLQAVSCFLFCSTAYALTQKHVFREVHGHLLFKRAMRLNTLEQRGPETVKFFGRLTHFRDHDSSRKNTVANGVLRCFLLALRRCRAMRSAAIHRAGLSLFIRAIFAFKACFCYVGSVRRHPRVTGMGCSLIRLLKMGKG